MENEGREQMAILPALAMRGIVMFPSMTLHFDVGREQSIHAIREAMSQDKRIFLAAQKDFTVESPQAEDIYTVGVVARIVQLLNNGKDSVRIMVEGLYKAEAVSYDLPVIFILPRFGGFMTMMNSTPRRISRKA